jgi:hypothetical protein
MKYKFLKEPSLLKVTHWKPKIYRNLAIFSPHFWKLKSLLFNFFLFFLEFFFFGGWNLGSKMNTGVEGNFNISKKWYKNRNTKCLKLNFKIMCYLKTFKDSGWSQSRLPFSLHFHTNLKGNMSSKLVQIGYKFQFVSHFFSVEFQFYSIQFAYNVIEYFHSKWNLISTLKSIRFTH